MLLLCNKPRRGTVDCQAGGPTWSCEMSLDGTVDWRRASGPESLVSFLIFHLWTKLIPKGVNHAVFLGFIPWPLQQLLLSHEDTFITLKHSVPFII